MFLPGCDVSSPTKKDAVVEWSRVRRALDIDTTTAKEYLIVFFEMDTDKDGRLSLEVRQNGGGNTTR